MKPVYGYSGKVELAKDYSLQIKPWLPVLEQMGVKTWLITKAAIIGSGLSQVIHRDLNLMPYLLSSDMLVQSTRILEQAGPVLLLVYYSGIDTLAHKYGPYADEVEFELVSIQDRLKNFIKTLSDQTKKTSLLILMADHGVMETRQTYFVKDIEEVMEPLMLPIGDKTAYCC